MVEYSGRHPPNRRGLCVAARESRMIEVAMPTMLRRPGVRQFVKFCIVGASSFLIDAGISFVLHFYMGVPLIIAKTISFMLAVTNGFFWNSRWTFETTDARKHHDRYAMFFPVN